MLIGADGIRPDPKKIEALNLLPLPGNVREMQLFLDIVNYLNRLNPKIANFTGSQAVGQEGKCIQKLQNTIKCT